jgi:(p)ppGpp synthase/HD superfamily hydrolase
MRASGAVSTAPPFIEHPLEVAMLLYHAGASDHVIAAGVLHDTIEKTSTNAAGLRARFGSAIATLLLAVSEDPRITPLPRARLHSASRSPPPATTR